MALWRSLSFCLLTLLFSDLENSKRAHSTSQGQLEQVQMSLAVEIKQRHQLEERFRILAANHEGMIKIKDEYKSEVKRLQDSTGSATKMKSELERKWAESDKQWAESLQAQKCREESIELELRRIVEERDTVIRGRGELAAVVEKERREVQDWRKKHQIAQSEITSLKKGEFCSWYVFQKEKLSKTKAKTTNKQTNKQVLVGEGRGCMEYI